ncbi:MAG: hypothetical protein NZZ60_05230 [Bacteroidia bacterium]|nr:hypothetical protein [Bacteroidia bacterium]MCX7652166.1 hypothetical protein [Bacteroidia bacterium]MDW8416885.1 hypothetical protein [Bacteroidia bacterium]
MRGYILLFLLGLAGWAQSMDSEVRASIHYDESRQALIVASDQPIGPEKLEIIDLIGRRIRILALPPILSAEVVAVPVADLPEGLYYARWLTENGRVRMVRRFSVER